MLPNLIKNKKSSDQIRIWSAGCASGEEAYTLAILMAEILGADEFRQRVKIYATDVDEEALNQARIAAYSAKEIRQCQINCGKNTLRLWGTAISSAKTCAAQ